MAGRNLDSFTREIGEPRKTGKTLTAWRAFVQADEALKGHTAGTKQFRVHLDGYNQLPYLTGDQKESPRNEFFYFGERNLFAIRYRNWKVHFQLKDDWFAVATVTRTLPRPVNLRNDPFRAAVLRNIYSSSGQK